MIGVITILARLVGFGRQVVFAHTVGTTCLGTAYTTANMVPNIIYDIVLGGALSSVVVPVLAGPALGVVGGLAGRVGGPAGTRRRRGWAGGDFGRAGAAGTVGRAGAVERDGAGEGADSARRIASALLTWTVILLVPVSAVLALAAHPIVTVLLSHASGCPRAVMAGVGARMLIVFAPQVLLYGLAVVLYGILQSYRRFGAPALAPLLSSLVVIAAYAAFGAIGGAYVFGNRLHELPPLSEYLLSGGTTLGVVALVATAVYPARRLRLGLRPMLRFPPGVGSRVRRLALAGVVTLVAQDASAAVVIVLSNRYGATGALVIYGFAWAVFMVPYAVLAVPIATSAFPALSAGAGSGAQADVGAGFDVTSATSTRAVMIASWLGAAALVGARVPVARVFESHFAPGASVLALALAAFAPGLVGYGISANLSRVLYALGRNRVTAVAIGGGWLLVIAADLAIVPLRRAVAGGAGARPRHVVRADRLRDSAAHPGQARARLGRAARRIARVRRRARGRGGRRGGGVAGGGGAVGARVHRQRRDVGAGDRRGHRGLRRRRGQPRRRRPPRRPGPSPCPPQLAPRRSGPACRASPPPCPAPSAAPVRLGARLPASAGALPPSRTDPASPSPGRVALVVGTTAGGTGAHVRMLAAGLAGRGIGVSVLGPSSADAAFGFGALDGVTFSPVEFGDRPGRGTWRRCCGCRRLLQYRGGAIGLATAGPGVVHAHGLRAGALTVLAIAGVSGPGPARAATGARGHGAQRAAVRSWGARADLPAPGACRRAPGGSGALRIGRP